MARAGEAQPIPAAEASPSRSQGDGAASPAGSVRARVFPLLDWFVPPRSLADSDERRRGRLIVGSALTVALLAVPLMVWSYLQEGHASLTVVAFAAGSVLMVTNPFVLRQTGSTRLAGTLTCLELLAALAVMSYANGGIVAASLIWGLAVPVLAGFLVGPGLAALCAGLVGIEALAFYLLWGSGTDVPHPLSQAQTLQWHVVAYATLGCFLAMLAWLYERSRRDVEATLRRSRQELATVVSSAPVILFALDRDGFFTMVEGKGLEDVAYGPDDLLGRSALDLYGEIPGARGHLVRALQGEATWFTATRGGRVFETRCVPVHEDGEVTGVIGAALDVTARARMREQLLISDRMASIGMLAAGVAHEINNPLTYVMTNLELLAADLADDAVQPDEQQELVSEALEGVRRVRHIVRDLKAFSTVAREERRPVDLVEAVEASIRMVWGEIRHRARLVKVYGEAPPVLASEARLGQVALNLVMNAAQAIEAGAAGRNEIRLSVGTDAAGNALLEVADTGKGIPAENLEKIFDPFFSTKPKGVGTGLGLSVCRTIVEGLGGTISCDSEPGRGATFRIVLPPAPADMTAEAEAETEEIDTGPGKVLVVDDDALVGRAVRRILRGCDVTVAESGEEALACLEHARFDVILCDLMMPNMTGMELFAEVCRSRPGVEQSMLFMTGGAFTPEARRFADEHESRLLEKPMDPSRLQLMVSALVEEQRAERARDPGAPTASGSWAARARDAGASTASGTWPAREREASDSAE